MVGVAVKLEQHVASAAAGHARGLGRQEAVPGIGRRGFRRGRGVRPGADVVEGQGLVCAGLRLLLAPARLRLLLASHGGFGRWHWRRGLRSCCFFGKVILPPTQNKCRNFELELVQNCDTYYGSEVVCFSLINKEQNTRHVHTHLTDL